MNVTSSVPAMFQNLEEIVFGSYIFPPVDRVNGGMTLPCIHVLCRSCVETVSSRTGRKLEDKMICVLCQLEFEISSVDVLHKRKTVEELLLEFSKAANDMKPLCERDSCRRTWNEVNSRSASTFCAICKTHSCFQCEDRHNNTYHSSVVQRGHWTEEPPNFKFCVDHKSHIKQLEVFCIACYQTDCFISLVENFSSDQIEVLDKLLADEIQSLSEIVEKVRAVKTQLEKKTQLESWKRETETEIERKYEELKKTVENQKDLILDQLKSLSSQVLKEIEQTTGKQSRQCDSFTTEHGPQFEASYAGQIRAIESHRNSVLIQLKSVNIERKEELERRKSIIDTHLKPMNNYMKSCVSVQSFGRSEEKFCAVGAILKKGEELKRELHFSATSNESSDSEKSFKTEYQSKNQGQSDYTATDTDIKTKNKGTTDSVRNPRQSGPSSMQDASRERSKNASATFETLTTGGQTYADQTRYQQGLVNFGNTCYFNAVIQCLCQTFLLLEELSFRNISKQPLTDSFVGFWKHKGKNSSEQSKAFSAFFEQLISSSPKFNNYRQHDSHDLFIHFLNDLRSEERLHTTQNVDPKKVLTTVDKVFGGHLITIYVCLECDQPHFVCECLLDISLPICIPKQQQQPQHLYSGRGIGEKDREPSERRRDSRVDIRRHQFGQTSYNDHGNGLMPGFLKALNEEQRISEDEEGRCGTRPVALTECLRFYTETEHIPEGYLCLYCQEGNQTTAATAKAQIMSPALKRTLIYNPPAVLVLHLKRFEQTSTGFTKRSNMVSYEELLDIGPYCNSDCLRIDSEDKNIWYSLYGVVVHIGSLDCGHYIAYVKVGDSNAKATKIFLQREFLEREQVAIEQDIKLTNRGKRAERKVEWQAKPTTGGRWISVSDSYTRNATLHEALNQEAFMLFYERVPKRDQ